MSVKLSTPDTDSQPSNSPPAKFPLQYEEECMHYIMLTWRTSDHNWYWVTLSFRNTKVLHQTTGL